MPATPKSTPKPAGRPAVGRTINVRVPDDLLAWLDAEAERSGTTRAAQIRFALQNERDLAKWSDELAERRQARKS